MRSKLAFESGNAVVGPQDLRTKDKGGQDPRPASDRALGLGSQRALEQEGVIGD